MFVFLKAIVLRALDYRAGKYGPSVEAVWGSEGPLHVMLKYEDQPGVKYNKKSFNSKETLVK